ncbi:hypothetical protein [Bacillus sp. T33-2]|uniref:hypothetical protein n=1 Tax=Bacillus sp. T33-2 TaxID=2054168 RepID=UPI000C78554F|nr:hypothetical protein [Bacillus sp. T33-2]PLR97405.1 hypothetical protein CVD19_07900 [Bacillus sp. T33-2]
MDLSVVWNHFIAGLNQLEAIKSAYYKKTAGIPFLYIEPAPGHGQDEIGKALRLSAAAAMKGKKLHCNTVFVRLDGPVYVYRHRFFVPQRKMFCCGNQCQDCIRLDPGGFKH